MQIKDDLEIQSWEQFGAHDPLWAIITDSDKRGQRWDVEKFFKTGEAEIASVIGYLQKVSPIYGRKGKALDFGCGVGRLTQALGSYYDEVCGVDVSSSMIKYANEYNKKPHCTFVVNQKDDLSIFPNESFDFVYSNITLQHLEKYHSKRYIQEFVRLLKPHGILLFQLPSHTNWTGKGILVRLLPDRVADVLRGNTFTQLLLSVFGKHNIQFIKMRGTGRQEVQSMLAAAGAKILDVQDDHAAGSCWISYRYCAIKTNP